MFYIAKRYFKGHCGARPHLHETENEFRDMTEENEQKKPKLEGQAALNLWRQGRVAWNRWIDQHPDWDISFENVDFSSLPVHYKNLSFEMYNFRNRNVSFEGVIFGRKGMSFHKAVFANGDVNFSDIHCKDGNLFFAEAVFDKCNVNFWNASLENCYLRFAGTEFGAGSLSLAKANLENIIFAPSRFEQEKFDATNLLVKHLAIFKFPECTTTLKDLNFQGAAFDGPLFFSGIFGIVPDIRRSRSSHPVELGALTVKLRRAWQRPGHRPAQLRVKAVSKVGIISRIAYKFTPKKRISLKYFNKLRRFWKHHCWPVKLSQVAEYPQEGARLRRLKEIAEANKDHQAALRFSADENRARRWIETSWFGSVLDMAFSAFSDYGQNILRPFVALIVLTVASMGLYKTLATETSAAGWTGWAHAALLSASNSLPFLPQSRDLRTGALKALYGTDPGLWIDGIMITQGVLSFIFLFLIGLGLRNRFRL